MHAITTRPGILLFVSWLTLCLFGFIMVTSASVELAIDRFDSPWYFSIRHGVYLGIAGAALLFTRAIPLTFWHDYHRWFFFGGILLLLMVLSPDIGLQANGSRRWLSLYVVSLQPAELFKIFLVLYLAAFLERARAKNIDDRATLVRVFMITVVPVGLILMQPDFGGAVVLVTAIFVMLFMAGVPLGRLAAFAAIAAGCGVATLVAQPYRLARLVAFMDPWAAKYTSGYQLTQSLIALGRGDWSGLGLGRSIQKLSYLPEAHTDFLFAVLGEELGFIGAVIVVGLFLFITMYGLYIGWRCLSANKFFVGLLAIGIAWLLGVQALINVGVNSGLLPTKGLTLPLMSYGGNSLVVSSVMVGLLLRIEYELAISKARHVK